MNVLTAGAPQIGATPSAATVGDSRRSEPPSMVRTGASAAVAVVGRFGAPRPRWPAVLRGLRCRCPACGQGRLFGKFVKPVERCAVCKESYTAQQADDFPPYIVILLLGHILVPTIVAVDEAFAPPLWMYATFGSVIICLLVIAMLQPVKGAVIAYQWACRMHGFASSVGTPAPAEHDLAAANARG